ncbi:hypothetical protein [Roseobacter sp. CCS2]|uniref:hypothetical protein n=1 Tax=Roseobacter sp. CCS2 TaxID=391593 RepID=UPI0000F3C75A|nr:hypothetical protein [Roseobacter sp. CCS2]EBA11773.1 hypothetical protein RCCS2_17631 [Roseobacter sp. CCS2]
MKDNTVPVDATAPLREPTRAQKREIMDLLDDVYDTDNECYQRGDTDETIAELLNVMPGWVAALREDFFGPSGGNEDMTAFKDELRAFITSAQAVKQQSEQKLDVLGREIEKAKGFVGRLESIQRAVGPRILQKVK